MTKGLPLAEALEKWGKVRRPSWTGGTYFFIKEQRIWVHYSDGKEEAIQIIVGELYATDWLPYKEEKPGLPEKLDLKAFPPPDDPRTCLITEAVNAIIDYLEAKK